MYVCMYVCMYEEQDIASHDDEGGLQHGFIVHFAGKWNHHRPHLLALPFYLATRLHHYPLRGDTCTYCGWILRGV